MHARNQRNQNKTKTKGSVPVPVPAFLLLSTGSPCTKLYEAREVYLPEKK